MSELIYSRRNDHGSALRSLSDEQKIPTATIIWGNRIIWCDSFWTATDILKDMGYYDQPFIREPAHIYTMEQLRERNRMAKAA